MKRCQAMADFSLPSTCFSKNLREDRSKLFLLFKPPYLFMAHQDASEYIGPRREDKEDFVRVRPIATTISLFKQLYAEFFHMTTQIG